MANSEQLQAQQQADKEYERAELNRRARMFQNENIEAGANFD